MSMFSLFYLCPIYVIDFSCYYLQVWAAVVPAGPANCQLNASYKTADGYAFQVQDLGVCTLFI